MTFARLKPQFHSIAGPRRAGVNRTVGTQVRSDLKRLAERTQGLFRPRYRLKNYSLYAPIGVQKLNEFDVDELCLPPRLIDFKRTPGNPLVAQDKVDRWIDSLPADDRIKDIAAHLVTELRFLDVDCFRLALDRFHFALNELVGGDPYVSCVLEGYGGIKKNKSGAYMARKIRWPGNHKKTIRVYEDKPVRNAVLAFNQFKRHADVDVPKVVFIDDASYSGVQLEDLISRFAEQVVDGAPFQPVILLAGITKIAAQFLKETLSRLPNVVDPLIVTTFQLTVLKDHLTEEDQRLLEAWHDDIIVGTDSLVLSCIKIPDNIPEILYPNENHLFGFNGGVFQYIKPPYKGGDDPLKSYRKPRY